MKPEIGGCRGMSLRIDEPRKECAGEGMASTVRVDSTARWRPV